MGGPGGGAGAGLACHGQGKLRGGPPVHREAGDLKGEGAALA
ncbi:hypothetical protein TCCBUS3UF1_22260 [Thermus sp. CCB_US3_UF1]|nr:hypothetical protein TCCBUS3UF1_22260 [Thermus sp. CCB_US3_UF1]